MVQLLSIFVVLRLAGFCSGQPGLVSGKQDSVINLISLAGYQNELHRVETDDGYILKLHRIFPKQEKNRRGPILLMHGFLGTAADFLLSGPSVALAYQLANEGYHVFLGNCRGSKFSMKHRVLNPLTAEFWRFSVDQIGMNDLPAIIDYILFLTNKKKIFYVGHNQGATALLILLSARPSFNDKIIQFHLLGPIAFMDHAHPMLLYKAKEFEEEAKVLGNFNFKSFIDLTKAIIESYCPETIAGSLRYCIRLWEFVFGRNQYETEIDSKFLRDIPEFISPTASIRQYLHFLQIARSGKFQSFQSRRFNLVPKEYRLTNVKVPVYIYHAAEDLVISRLDVERLRNILVPIVKVYKIIPNFNHYDLVLSKNGKQILYDDVVKACTNDGLDLLGFIGNILG